MSKNYREGGISKVFDRNSAEREARRFLRKGLDSRIRHSIDALGPDRLKGSTVLDVGCGVGALHQSLILAGARRIVGVDASLNNITVAQELAAKLKYSDYVSHFVGDVVELEELLPCSDVVILDRVVCCCPSVVDLLKFVLAKCNCTLIITIPQVNLATVGFQLLFNASMWITRNEFRYVLHDPVTVTNRVLKDGFVANRVATSYPWEATVYRRC